MKSYSITDNGHNQLYVIFIEENGSKPYKYTQNIYNNRHIERFLPRMPEAGHQPVGMLLLN